MLCLDFKVALIESVDRWMTKFQHQAVNGVYLLTEGTYQLEGRTEESVNNRDHWMCNADEAMRVKRLPSWGVEEWRGQGRRPHRHSIDRASTHCALVCSSTVPMLSLHSLLDLIRPQRRIGCLLGWALSVTWFTRSAVCFGCARVGIDRWPAIIGLLPPPFFHWRSLCAVPSLLHSWMRVHPLHTHTHAFTSNPLIGRQSFHWQVFSQFTLPLFAESG